MSNEGLGLSLYNFYTAITISWAIITMLHILSGVSGVNISQLLIHYLAETTQKLIAKIPKAIVSAI
ncbi:MAG: hypothetical protein DRN81_06115 [Thermoproteota archaeon]|nr:MAG: hypothetical protein DRN81_06115 [Candidatus Korarchaeota archaeon]